MNRDYNDGKAENITFFAGIEIEATPAYGKKTLFVVGVHPAEKVLALYKQFQCEHIYFGANQSFAPKANTQEEWKPWETMVQACLDQNVLCTLDLDVKYVEDLAESGLCESNYFIPQISVKIPYIKLLNYNATLKIDDKGFKATNPGVWCHQIHDLQNRLCFTDWSGYGTDQIIE
jgi:hypothetical protein